LKFLKKLDWKKPEIRTNTIFFNSLYFPIITKLCPPLILLEDAYLHISGVKQGHLGDFEGLVGIAGEHAFHTGLTPVRPHLADVHTVKIPKEKVLLLE